MGKQHGRPAFRQLKSPVKDDSPVRWRGLQAQALPVIMSGRDCIGIAKTGSGKTLAFVLPMLRHIKDQPPLAVGDGPVAMVMAPTRELVSQIGKVSYLGFRIYDLV